MPPRLPHGLKRNPIYMDAYEKTVFGILGASITAGLFHLATSPLYKKEEENDTGTSTDSKLKSKEDKDKAKEKSFFFSV
eukprot:CAMPEP_0197237766 /NCGR_PEP_ID=MMETSP1429-20130617/4508_1 /TAXON_ID=49237 /ORGANISM="Chaetoceros  sp., Strain UNC1202" /LENGTH=78 /DNA_ID=CAMNT_0042696827 /DNA_START=124 /DNA_END=360 /DNA_ORIENTATION=-